MLMKKIKQTTLFQAVHTCFKLRAGLLLCQSGISHSVHPACPELPAVLQSHCQLLPQKASRSLKLVSVCVAVLHRSNRSSVVNFSLPLYLRVWCKLTEFTKEFKSQTHRRHNVLDFREWSRICSYIASSSRQKS